MALTPHLPQRGLPIAALMINALVWGLSWWPFRWLEAHGLHPLWATACVYGTALIGIALLRPQAWTVLRAQPLLWLLALASGLTNVGFNWAVTTGDVVRVVLLFYLMPMWSIGLAWWLLGERPTAVHALRLALALAGVALVLQQPGQPLPWPASGSDWLALLGGWSFALTNVLLLKLAHTPDDGRMLAMFGGGTLMATLVALLGSVMGVINAPPALTLDWVGPAMLLSLAFLVGNLALQYGAARLPAAVTALVMLSEIVFASASSVWLGAALMEPRVLLGGALILFAALLAAWPVRSKPAGIPLAPRTRLQENNRP
jgi:drug/metabolite transporter (DMT)-like permease